MRCLPFFAALLLAALAAGARPEEPAWRLRRRAEDRIVRGFLELARDAPEAAARAFSEAVELAPTSARAVFLRGLALLETGQAREALDCLEAADRLVAPGKDEAPPAALLLARERALRALDRSEEADIIAKVVGRPEPEDVEGCLWLGWFMFRPSVENLEAARGALVRAIAKHPRRDPFLGRIALSAVSRRLGDLDAALEQARVASRHDRARSGVFQHLADLHGLRLDRPRERRALEQAVLLDPDDVVAAARLADLDVADGRLNGAFDRLNALLARPDAPPSAHWTRAWVHLRFGQVDESVEDLVPALASAPEAGIPGRVDPSTRRLHPEAWAEVAAATARLDAAEDGAVPDLYLRLRGRAYLRLGRYAEALADLERAVEIAPGHAAILAPEILRARVEAKPEEARRELTARLRRVRLPDERVEIGRLVLRTLVVEGRWADAAPAAADLLRRMAGVERDLVRQGVEPGARARREHERMAWLVRLLEARGRLAAGDPEGAERIVAEPGFPDVRSEALAIRAYMVARDLARASEARKLIGAAEARHEPTRLRSRGDGHPLNGWTMRFAAETHRLLGDEEASAKRFALAVLEGLPTWAEEILDPSLER